MTDKVSLLPVAEQETSANPFFAQYLQLAQYKSPEGRPKDAGQAAGDAAPADGPKIDVGDKVFNAALGIKPDQIGQGFRDAQDAAKAFMGVPDHKDALAKGTPAFEAAIKQSDADYISAIAKYSPDFDQKKTDLQNAEESVVMTLAGVKGLVENLPEDKQGSIAAMVGLAVDTSTSPELKAALFKEMDQYPGLRKVCEAGANAMSAEKKAEQDMHTAAQPLIKAAYEQAATRFIYSHALELGGDSGKAYMIKQEGQSKVDDAFFEYFDKPKPAEPSMKV